MNKFAIIFSLLSVIIISVSCESQQSNHYPDRGYLVKIGDKVENINFDLIDGTRLDMKSLKGKVIVLQFTASWCSVCRKEMPHLESEVWQRFKNDDFILIGVDYDEELEKVITFQEQMKVTYPMALDPGAEIFGKFAHKKSGVTRNIVIDKEGNIVFLTRLYERKEFEEMLNIIDKLLKS